MQDRFGDDKLWFKVVTAFSWNGPVPGVRRPQWGASVCPHRRQSRPQWRCDETPGGEAWLPLA